MLSYTEENYLKAIFKISEKEKKSASTNSLARHLDTTPASVTDMLKRLAEKEMIHYERYKGVTLTAEGNRIATSLIRRHRLWEVFLVEKLRFDWEHVHDLAEELEHIYSEELISRLDAFLNYPKFDPHGDSIPNAEGKFTIRNQMPLSDLMTGQSCQVLGVKEHSNAFLRYLNQIKVKPGTQIKIEERIEFDASLRVLIDQKERSTISDSVAQSLLVKRI
ncbi:MAG TPA: metal-dependent transcriptional regulator [Saprospiraceae bacterium]|nr:metal-dependent transcriptional regulator [Saprospiraceae bacterium]